MIEFLRKFIATLTLSYIFPPNLICLFILVSVSYITKFYFYVIKQLIVFIHKHKYMYKITKSIQIYIYVRCVSNLLNMFFGKTKE